MEISLPFGHEEHRIHLPPEADVEFVRPRSMPVIAEAEDALREILSAPVSGDSLDTMLADATSVVVLMADITRGKGTGRLLAPLIRYIRDAGVDVAGITVLVARGTHRSMTKEERGMFRDLPVRVVEHDADKSDKLSALVLTRHGTPVRTNALLKDADVVILFAPVSYHYFAGFGGGRKLVLPGCADRQAILANHKLSLTDGNPVTLNPACGTGVLDGNPVHEDMCETLDALSGRGLFGINFFCDAAGELIFVNAGDPIKAHLDACEVYDTTHRTEVGKPFDVMVLSAGGHPFDICLLQAHKSIRQAAGALRDGATILYFAECGEGIGSDSLEAALKSKHDDFLKNAYKDYALNNQTAVSLLDLTSRFEIGIVSAMNVDTLLAAGFKHCVNAEAFLADALDRHSTDRIAVVTHGASVLVTVKEAVR